MEIRFARVYDDPTPDDGRRVLVDRLWPRGVTKERAAIDLWPKEATPSNDLRRWFHAEPEGRRDEFRERYLAELHASGAADELRESLQGLGKVTFVTAAKEPDRCHAQVLAEALGSS